MNAPLAIDSSALIVDLNAEVAHWKANHTNMVQRCAYLQQRPDLPVDRIPAFEAHVEQLAVAQSMLKLSEVLRARQYDENQALRAAPSQMFAPQCDTAAGRQFEREAFAKGLHLAALIKQFQRG